MKVYRIGKSEYINDLEGIGSKLYGGRWNQMGTPCIYTSESRALAVLEYLVNVSIQYIPPRLSIAAFEINENSVESISLKKLPKDWQTIPASYSTKKFGTELLKKGVPCFKIPSVVIPNEFNYIINPLAGSYFFQQIQVETFDYDIRIKKK